MRAAILSGALAAAAGAFSKIAFGGDNIEESLVLRGFCLACMILSNIYMIQYFVQGMRDSGSVVGTTINVSANVFCSAMFGALFFNEYDRLTMRWICGASLALIGVYCLSRGGGHAKHE